MEYYAIPVTIPEIIGGTASAVSQDAVKNSVHFAYDRAGMQLYRVAADGSYANVPVQGEGRAGGPGLGGRTKSLRARLVKTEENAIDSFVSPGAKDITNALTTEVLNLAFVWVVTDCEQMQTAKGERKMYYYYDAKGTTVPVSQADMKAAALQVLNAIDHLYRNGTTPEDTHRLSRLIEEASLSSGWVSYAGDKTTLMAHGIDIYGIDWPFPIILLQAGNLGIFEDLRAYIYGRYQDKQNVKDALGVGRTSRIRSNVVANTNENIRKEAVVITTATVAPDGMKVVEQLSTMQLNVAVYAAVRKLAEDPGSTSTLDFVKNAGAARSSVREYFNENP